MTDGFFFQFGSFDEEIARKIRSLEAGPDRLAEELWARLRGAAFAVGAVSELQELFRRLRGVPFDDVYPGYLTHPIRVAAGYASLLDRPSNDDLALALCHNLNETSGPTSTGEVRRLLSPGVLRRIDTLTIDRKRERDPGYLNDYYDSIAAEDLLPLKALDKLDNALWWVDFDVEAWEADVILSFLCPRLAPHSPRLAAYLAGLVPHVLSADVKCRHRRNPA